MQDPDTDFSTIYDAEYYAGRGADPLVRYDDDVTDIDRSTRVYELRGLLERAASLVSLEDGDPWLDFGCGSGTFVSFLRRHNVSAFGFDQGFAAEAAIRRGVPMFKQADLDARVGSFAIVSAIEVLEHVVDPVQTLERIAACLRPGGLFFYTTGNSRPFEAKLCDWSYVVPEIHISFYQPKTMLLLFEKSGLVPLPTSSFVGWTDIIRYKVLKNLRIHQRNAFEASLPWHILSAAADRKYKISAMMPAKKPV